MQEKYIHQIIQNNTFPDVKGSTQLIETHISWVILTKNFAFKIKKPLKYSFLDFSTLEKRRFFCEREILLNNRLTSGVYLEVLPLKIQHENAFIGNEPGKIINYAVKMKRLNIDLQMNLLLETDRVTEKDMDKVADILSRFHQKAEVIKTPFDPNEMKEDFADILQVKNFLSDNLGQKAVMALTDSVKYSDDFVHIHADRFRARNEIGYTRDCHGDLHSKNIFLGENPVIFDCIEFNDHFRQVDILNELAFFCMDLDFYGKSQLGSYFLDSYLKKYPCIENEEDKNIFQYYKLYRANIRTKVNALKAMQTDAPAFAQERLKLVEDYLILLQNYLRSQST